MSPGRTDTRTTSTTSGPVIATADGMATVRTANGVETVATTLLDPVAAGELVLVHAGTAISRVDADEGVR